MNECKEFKNPESQGNLSLRVVDLSDFPEYKRMSGLSSRSGIHSSSEMKEAIRSLWSQLHCRVFGVYVGNLLTPWRYVKSGRDAL